jgi:hypothetical protein
MTRSSNQASSILMERAVASHVALYIVGVTWAFGGNADWVKTPISLWGSVGILLTLSILSRRGPRSRIIAGTLPWALPIVALNAVVAVSCLTPGFINLHLGNEAFLIPARVDGWIPSAARPEVALRSLWLFDGLYFSCFQPGSCSVTQACHPDRAGCGGGKRPGARHLWDGAEACRLKGHLFWIGKIAPGLFLRVVCLRQPLGRFRDPHARSLRGPRS